MTDTPSHLDQFEAAIYLGFADVEDVPYGTGTQCSDHKRLSVAFARHWRVAQAARATIAAPVGDLREARIAELAEALAFYADPETYHACSFMFDRPTGGFDEDFNADHGHEDYERPMPGKLARAALAVLMTHSASGDNV